jgi:hypothetical protein
VAQQVTDGKLQSGYTVNNGSEREYDGDFSVTLSQNGQPDIVLNKREWDSLFFLVCQNIPAYIKRIENNNSNG